MKVLSQWTVGGSEERAKCGRYVCGFLIYFIITMCADIMHILNKIIYNKMCTITMRFGYGYTARIDCVCVFVYSFLVCV